MLAVLLVAVAAGCAADAGPAADPEQIAAAEARLLAPLDARRVVFCDRLEVVMSANFDAEVARPAVGRDGGDMRHESFPDGSSVTTFSARTKPPFQPLTVRVGGTEFTVLRLARIELIGGRTDYRFEVSASGDVEVIEGDQRQALPAGFVVRDGRRVTP